LEFTAASFLQEKHDGLLHIDDNAKFFCWLTDGAEMGARKSVEKCTFLKRCSLEAAGLKSLDFALS